MYLSPIETHSIKLSHVRIRVGIDPPHPFVCRKRRLNGRPVLRMRPEKPRPRVSRCGTIKIPPCSKALSAEHSPKFCSPSPPMVTSPYTNMNWTVKKNVNFINSSQNEGLSPSGMLYPSTDLAQSHGTLLLVFIRRLFHSFTFFGFPTFSTWASLKRLD
jgi:hypothetical protein